jgi:hypothetical protein
VRNIAIKKAVNTLEDQYGVVFDDLTALDFFARDASWQTVYYANKVKKIHAWEVENSFKNDLINNLPPQSQILIGDSHKLILKETQKFDLIVIDNPQGCYGNNKQYCEHFEALPLCLKNASDNSVILFNVKTKPFNYEDKLLWQKARQKFYKKSNCSDLSVEFMHKFYSNLFKDAMFEVRFSFDLLRPQEDGLHLFVYGLSKGKED